MDLCEIRKEIEALRKRMESLEDFMINVNDVDYNCGGQVSGVESPDSDVSLDELTDVLTNKEDPIVVIKKAITKEITMKIIIMRVGTEIEKNTIPKNRVVVTYQGNLKFMTLTFQSAEELTLSDFFDIRYSGLGMGKGHCKSITRFRCNKKNLDEDCVDFDAYMNRCDEKCRYMCGYGEWHWYRDTSCDK